MRRLLAPVLVGLGVFLIVGALLLRFYAYPKLAVAPKDQNSVTELSATGATVFDLSKLEQVTTDLTIKSTTRGDAAASDKAPEGVVVWVSTQRIWNSDGGKLSEDSEISPMDANTAEAVNCCNSSVDVVNRVGTPIEREGLVFKFPFDTQKKTYQVWDGTLRAAAPAVYAGTEKIQGLPVYKFTMDIPSTVVGTLEVPASFLGLSGTENVDADSNYSVQRTYWVEPTIGTIIDRVDNQRSWLSYGSGELVTTEGEISYTDAQVAQNVKDYKSRAKLLSGVHSTFPIVGGLIGLLALAVGLLLGRGSSARRKA